MDFFLHDKKWGLSLTHDYIFILTQVLPYGPWSNFIGFFLMWKLFSENSTWTLLQYFWLPSWEPHCVCYFHLVQALVITAQHLFAELVQHGILHIPHTSHLFTPRTKSCAFTISTYLWYLRLNLQLCSGFAEVCLQFPWRGWTSLLLGKLVPKELSFLGSRER